MIDGDFVVVMFVCCFDGIGVFVLVYVIFGVVNFCVLFDVVINEIELNGDVMDWVEVMNIGSMVVDLFGWIVMDSDFIGYVVEIMLLLVGMIL